MMHIEGDDPIEQLREISIDLNADFEEGHGAAKIMLDNERGKGIISTFRTVPGLSLTCYNISFRQEMKFELGAKGDRSIYLFYCIEGHLRHVDDVDGATTKIRRGQNLIISPSSKKGGVIVLPKGRRLKMSIIIVSDPDPIIKDNSQRSELVKILGRIRSDVLARPSHKYIGGSRGLVDEHSRLLLENNRTDVVGRLLSEAALLYTLALQLRERQRFFEGKYNDTSLKAWEIEKILGVSDLLRKDIRQSYTQKELARITDIGEGKLQQGFQYLFGKSVNGFVRHFRIQKAKELFETTNASVAEVSQEVGIPNRSYFAKSFRQAFGHLPKDYRNLHADEGWSFELSYRSVADVSLSPEDIEELAFRSNGDNIKGSVTGCLVHCKGEFFQFIEGPKDNVLELYERIARDPRHSQVDLIWKGARRKRVFRHWGMALVTDSTNAGHGPSQNGINIDIEGLKKILASEKLPALRFWEKIRNLIIVTKEEAR